MHFVNKLRMLRAKRGMTQQQLADQRISLWCLSKNAEGRMNGVSVDKICWLEIEIEQV